MSEETIVIKCSVIGGAQFAARLRTMSGNVRAQVVNQIRRLGLELLTKVKADYLSGQSLHVRSGRLRRSINEQTTDNGSSITSSVGTNVSYGRIHELGFTGIEQVRAHIRVCKSGLRASVREYQRHVTIPARSFLQPALADMAPRIMEQFAKIGAALDGA